MFFVHLLKGHRQVCIILVPVNTQRAENTFSLLFRWIPANKIAFPNQVLRQAPAKPHPQPT